MACKARGNPCPGALVCGDDSHVSLKADSRFPRQWRIPSVALIVRKIPEAHVPVRVA